ncbi:MAG: ribonuclease D [Alphaproteobacteria bacterium]|nr:ribonuclease D [Alphaproteobacteria bacterium]
MTITLHRGDIPAGLSFGDSIAIDTESMGLNWSRDRLCVVQLSSGDGNAHLVQFPKGSYDAPNLKKLLTDQKVLKIFHYARADIVPIAHYLGVMTQPVYCTKIASALVRTFSSRHSLKILTKDLLGIELSKEQQTSDWGADKLSEDQQRYAATDVLHLHAIRKKLDEMLAREGRTEAAKAAMEFLRHRAQLDLEGFKDIDIFSYNPIPMALS